MAEIGRSREDYIGDIIREYPRIYNSWRAIRFTDKGKKAGCSDEWSNFKSFFWDVVNTYKRGLTLRRLDNTKPWSRSNFIWCTQEEAAYLKSNMIELTYNGETLPLKDIADKYGVSLMGIKNRYHKHKDYSVEEIIFGKRITRGSKIPKDVNGEQALRAKASKMISTYRFKDAKMGLPKCDIDIDWMLTNIISKPCIYCEDTKRVGCDRIDNNKGHTKDNVVPCCYECNCARNNNFSYKEMLILGKTIKQIKASRNGTKVNKEI